jgi:cytochrome b6-f complex iron-sulfur subunit
MLYKSFYVPDNPYFCHQRSSMPEHFTRNKFIKALAGLIFLPFIYLFGKAVQTGINTAGNKKVVLTGPFSEGISFYDRFILVKRGHSFHIFSNRCTHLGCTIQSAENSILRCPCHGSEFNTEGNAVKGPAYRPLQTLSFTHKNGILTVFLK